MEKCKIIRSKIETAYTPLQLNYDAGVDAVQV